MSEVKTFGTKIEVYKGKAKKTRGNLTKDDLMKNKRGRIVSKKQYEAGVKRYQENKDKMTPFKAKVPEPPRRRRRAKK